MNRTYVTVANIAMSLWLPLTGLAWLLGPFVRGGLAFFLWTALAVAASAGVLMLWLGGSKRGSVSLWCKGYFLMVAVWVIGLWRMTGDPSPNNTSLRPEQTGQTQETVLSSGPVQFFHILAGLLLFVVLLAYWSSKHPRARTASESLPQAAPSVSQPSLAPHPIVSGPSLGQDVTFWFLLGVPSFILVSIFFAVAGSYNATPAAKPLLWLTVSAVFAAVATILAVLVSPARKWFAARQVAMPDSEAMDAPSKFGNWVSIYWPAAVTGWALWLGSFSVLFALNGGSPVDFVAKTTKNLAVTALAIAAVPVAVWVLIRIYKFLNPDRSPLKMMSDMSCSQLLSDAYAMDHETKVFYANELRVRAANAHCGVCQSRGARDFWKDWSYR